MSRRVRFEAVVPVGNPDFGAEQYIDVTCDVAPEGELVDAVTFVEPDLGELESFFGVRESGLDRIREQADYAASQQQKQAEARSKQLVDELLNIGRAAGGAL